MILYVHRDRTDTIDLTAVANQFVEKPENRTEAVVWLDVYLQWSSPKAVFGRACKSCIPMKWNSLWSRKAEMLFLGAQISTSPLGAYPRIQLEARTFFARDVPSPPYQINLTLLGQCLIRIWLSQAANAIFVSFKIWYFSCLFLGINKCCCCSLDRFSFATGRRDCFDFGFTTIGLVWFSILKCAEPETKPITSQLDFAANIKTNTKEIARLLPTPNWNPLLQFVWISINCLIYLVTLLFVNTSFLRVPHFHFTVQLQEHTADV